VDISLRRGRAAEGGAEKARTQGMSLSKELAILLDRLRRQGSVLSTRGAWLSLSLDEPAGARPGSGVTGISRKSIGYARAASAAPNQL
jgi:hypothetical protein